MKSGTEDKERDIRNQTGCMIEPNGFTKEKQSAEAALNNSLYTIAAFENNQAVGMGRLIGDGMYLVIADIVVSPAYQKKGIGSKIISMLIEHAAEELPEGGRTSIQLISEKGKEAFYEKLGFKRIPNDFCGFGMRKVIRR